MPSTWRASVSKLSRNIARACAGIAMVVLAWGCTTGTTAGGGAPTTYQAYVYVYAIGAVPGTPPGPCGPANGGYIVCVSVDPIVLTPNARPIDIYWDLPANGPWTFDKNKGIVIKGGGGWNEHPVSAYRYVARSNSKDNLFYKYEINAVNSGATATWDPFIWNN